MAHSQNPHGFSWRGSPRHNSPTPAMAHGAQQRNETRAPDTSSYSGFDATRSQADRVFADDLHLLRTGRASFASSSLTNALGESTFYTESTHSEPVAQQPSTRTSRARSSVAGSSMHRRSADVTSPHETVFSVGHDYQDQWKAERPQPQPAASNSKVPRVLATTPRALAARKGRGAGAQDLFNLNERLPYPWHKFDDPLNRRVIPAAIKYIDVLHERLREKDQVIEEKNQDLETCYSALETAHAEKAKITADMKGFCRTNAHLRELLQNHGVQVHV
ncbi:hypothetical protein EVG20_g4440 [Dentipellis fragilis]|uniref:Uncharacterized protein n=1 Tax=Dentipellis fragilis TaxID=205917 RepID=A0A4Y9YY24_9AGAM|nr:hypothetical protein EVG20_g4440 [Dentipellis fragilis]